MYTLRDLSYQKKARTRDELVAHMKSFTLERRLSVGIWYFTPAGGRFHEPYVKPATIKERLDMAAGMAKYGVTGIEAHFPDEVNFDNLHLYKELEAKTGISLVAVPFSHFYQRDFEFGSLSNPDPRVREKATGIAAEGLRLVKEAGAACAISWPGIDGYTYSLGTVFPWMWSNFERSLADAMDRVPGVRVAIEPKPYEPAPNNIYRTTAEGILAAARIERRLEDPENRSLLDRGFSLVGLNPEVGHVRMGFEDAPAAFALTAMEGRLAHTHINSQPLGNYDQDLNVGVVEWQQAEALLYALKMAGYEEYFGIDINPERMPVEKAVELNAKALRVMSERIERLPHERIIDCYMEPDRHRGELEEILIDAMRR